MFKRLISSFDSEKEKRLASKSLSTGDFEPCAVILEVTSGVKTWKAQNSQLHLSWPTDPPMAHGGLGTLLGHIWIPHRDAATIPNPELCPSSAQRAAVPHCAAVPCRCTV